MMRIQYAHMKAPTRRKLNTRPTNPGLTRRARKTPTNLSVRADLVREAKALDLNLSQILETALEQTLRHRRRAAWLAENRDAISAYNARRTPEFTGK